MPTQITLTDDRSTVTLPWGKNYQSRVPEGSIKIFIGSVLGTDITVDFALTPEGDIEILIVDGRGTKNPYAHLSISQSAELPKPTEAQIARVARAFLMIEPFFGSGTGSSLQRWAFAGFKDPDELSRKYGTGKKVYLS